MSSNAYASAAARAVRPGPDADPRDIDAWALGQAANKLMVAMSSPGDVALLQEAVSTNQRLWTIFQADVASDQCQMPLDVRKNILQLSLYVDKQSMERLIDRDAEKLRILIDINVNLAAALRESRQSGEPIKQVPATPNQTATGVAFQV
ncbi:MAG: flagellar biosynthesis regulator FlaF [Pseudomonadota bacterium]